jgi:hypothetical protein
MKIILFGLLLATGVAGAAAAAPVYPVAVVSTDQNGTVVAPDRSNPNAVIGAADGVFYSLGLGGNMVLDFGQQVGSPGMVAEVTFRLEGYIEKMEIYVSSTLDFLAGAVATVSNQSAGLPGGAVVSFSSDPFRYVKLVDISPVVKGRDGFDVDSISFSPVPVPAAGLLLGGALFGLGALRRRAKKA